MHILTCCTAWNSLLGKGIMCAERSKKGAKKEGGGNEREESKVDKKQ